MVKLDFKKQLVVVTGGTKGIGKATAASFLESGAKVIVTARKDTDAAVKELSALGEVYGIACDLSTKEGTDTLIKEAAKIGPVDILVNNVGIFEPQEFFGMSDEVWQNYIDVNFFSTLRLSRHYLGEMLKRDVGSIVIVSSETGMRPIKEMLQYSVTKAMQISLARGLAELTKGTNVRVNSVLPGPTWTEGVANFVDKIAKDNKQSLDQAIKDFFVEREPNSLIARFLNVKEVADTIVFTSSNKGISGAAQKVEGGVIRTM
eukprot:Platyproteum_vivax@DN7541_c0_g1_i3.p1